MRRNTRIIRVQKLTEQDKDFDLKNTMPAEHWAMMWQLTLDAWAFRGEPLSESRFPQRIVRVLRQTGFK